MWVAAQSLRLLGKQEEDRLRGVLRQVAVSQLPAAGGVHQPQMPLAQFRESRLRFPFGEVLQ